MVQHGRSLEMLVLREQQDAVYDSANMKYPEQVHS